MATGFEIRDPELAPQGLARMDWALSEMPVLRGLLAEFSDLRPFADVRVSACLHITTETGNLARVLQAGGADLVLCASNPMSTQDDVAAALVDEGVAVYARRGDDVEAYYRHIDAALDHRPHVTLDDGADLVTMAHQKRPDLLAQIRGGTEETTTGVMRLRSMAREGVLRYPIIAVNDADTKHLFDNRYGTGQSSLDGIIRATNFLIAGRVITIAGYGWCGRGIAMRARGHGARVIVTEVEPVRALEALMDGFEVLPMQRAASFSDIIVTATGDRDVVGARLLAVLKDGCTLANAGHFDVEVDVRSLRRMAVSVRRPRPLVEEFSLEDGRRIRLLAEGRLVNLVAAEGHPAMVMDMSFANQVLCVQHLVRHGDLLSAQVHPVPAEIDREVARRKLDATGARIDVLTPEQQAYMHSWTQGT